MLDYVALICSGALALYAVGVVLFKLSKFEHVDWKQSTALIASALAIVAFVCCAVWKVDLGFPRQPGSKGGFIDLDWFEWGMVIIVILIQIVYIRYTEVRGPSPEHTIKMTGKVCIVTGSNGGIGFEMAKTLASQGARVIMACRSETSANKAAAEIRAHVEKLRKDSGEECANMNEMVQVSKLDLASFESVRQFAKELDSKNVQVVDVLINNAGYMGFSRCLTVDKLETSMQVNCFAPLLLTLLLIPKLQKSTFVSGGRVVYVGSSSHMKASRQGVEAFPIDDFNFESGYSMLHVYAISKWAALLLQFHLHRLLAQQGEQKVHVNVVSPGSMRTSIIRDMHWFFRLGRMLLFPFEKTVHEGSFTTVHVATSQLTEGESGKYYEQCREAPLPPSSRDPALAEQLWERAVKVIDFKLSSVGL